MQYWGMTSTVKPVYNGSVLSGYPLLNVKSLVPPEGKGQDDDDPLLRGFKKGVLKPWPNGVASSRKLRTWVYLRLRLARTCVHLR